MKRPFKNSLRALIAGMLFTPAIAQAEVGNDDRSQIETIVREYLISNPEIITEALTELENRRVAQEEKARQQVLTELSDILYDSEYQVVLGNPEGDVTLVEFFDYNCGYCKRALNDLIKLTDEDDQLRVVLKEFPVLGQPSLEAALAIAVNEVAPEMYEDFHVALLNAPGRANLASAMKVATDLGIPEEDLKKGLDSDAVAKTLQEVFRIAEGLGLTGTPSYVVGKDVVIGAVGYDNLKEKIAEQRK